MKVGERTDLYSILGVPRSAPAAELKAAYRSLAKQYHPDVGGTAADGRRMAAINYAYHVLGDPTLRQQYDLENPTHGIHKCMRHSWISTADRIEENSGRDEQCSRCGAVRQIRLDPISGTKTYRWRSSPNGDWSERTYRSSTSSADGAGRRGARSYPTSANPEGRSGSRDDTKTADDLQYPGSAERQGVSGSREFRLMTAVFTRLLALAFMGGVLAWALLGLGGSIWSLEQVGMSPETDPDILVFIAAFGLWLSPILVIGVLLAAAWKLHDRIGARKLTKGHRA